jgi:hypothetical protein
LTRIVVSRRLAPAPHSPAGEFIEIYSKPEHAGAFDAVATCFFIDTAPVAMEYIEVIKHVLRPGGVWVNCGPLSFHWQAPDPEAEPDAVGGGGGGGSSGAGVDARYGRSVELAYSEVRHAIIASGFKIVVSRSEQRVEERLPAYTQAGALTSYSRLAAAPSRHTRPWPLQKEGTSKSTYASDRLSLSKLLYTAVTFSAIKQ